MSNSITECLLVTSTWTIKIIKSGPRGFIRKQQWRALSNTLCLIPFALEQEGWVRKVTSQHHQHLYWCTFVKCIKELQNDSKRWPSKFYVWESKCTAEIPFFPVHMVRWHFPGSLVARHEDATKCLTEEWEQQWRALGPQPCSEILLPSPHLLPLHV